MWARVNIPLNKNLRTDKTNIGFNDRSPIFAAIVDEVEGAAQL